MQSIDDDAIATSVAAPGERLPGAPLIFRENRGPKGRKKIFKTAPSPHIKVWVWSQTGNNAIHPLNTTFRCTKKTWRTFLRKTTLTVKRSPTFYDGDGYLF